MRGREMDSLLMKELSNEEVLSQEFAKPGQSIQLLKLRLLDQVRHPSEAADAHHVEGHVVPCHAGAKVHLESTRQESVLSLRECLQKGMSLLFQQLPPSRTGQW